MFDQFQTALPGCFEIQPIVRGDSRGRFVKTFHANTFNELSLETEFPEQYYSVSAAGVLRGLHFQTPPMDHNKLVYCTSGRILDAVLDIRLDSPTFGKSITLELSAAKANMIYIPKGMAHGFYSITDATVAYNVSTVYSPEHDAGILWNSAGIDWAVSDPSLSERDRLFEPFDQFESPFSI